MYPTRRIFSSRSSLENPSPLQMLVRTTSPSRTSTASPRSRKARAVISETVVLPAPDSPVNQRVKPSCITNLPPDPVPKGRGRNRSHPPLPFREGGRGVRSCRDHPTLHVAWDLFVEQVEDSRTQVDQSEARRRSAPSAIALVENEDALLSVVGVVWTSVVFEGVHRAVADAADRAPVQIAKVHDQVRRDVSDRAIDLLRLVDARAKGSAVRPGNRPQSLGDLVPHSLVVGRRDGSVWLATFDVHEQPTIVAAITPGDGLAPVDAELGERR